MTCFLQVIEKIQVLVVANLINADVQQTWISYLILLCQLIENIMDKTVNSSNFKLLAMNCLRMRTHCLIFRNKIPVSISHQQEVTDYYKILQIIVANFRYKSLINTAHYVKWMLTYILQLLSLTKKQLQFQQHNEENTQIKYLSSLYLEYMGPDIFTMSLLQLIQTMDSIPDHKDEVLYSIIDKFNDDMSNQQAEVFTIMLCRQSTSLVEGWRKWLRYYWNICYQKQESSSLIDTFQLYVTPEASQIIVSIFSEPADNTHVCIGQNTYLKHIIHSLLHQKSNSWQDCFNTMKKIEKLLCAIYAKSKDPRIIINLSLFLESQLVTKVYFGSQYSQIVYGTCRKYLSQALLLKLSSILPKIVNQQMQQLVLLQKSVDHLCQVVQNIQLPILLQIQIANTLIQLSVNLKILIKINQKLYLDQKLKNKQNILARIIQKTKINQLTNPETCERCSQKFLTYWIQYQKQANFTSQPEKTIVLSALHRKPISQKVKTSLFSQILLCTALINSAQIYKWSQYTLFYAKNSQVYHIISLDFCLNTAISLLSDQQNGLNYNNITVIKELQRKWKSYFQYGGDSQTFIQACIGLLINSFVSKIFTKVINKKCQIFPMQQQDYIQFNTIFTQPKIVIKLLQVLDSQANRIPPYQIYQMETQNVNNFQIQHIQTNLKLIFFKFNSIHSIVFSYVVLKDLIYNFQISQNLETKYQIFENIIEIYPKVRQMVNKICHKNVQNHIVVWLQNSLCLAYWAKLLRLFLIKEEEINIFTNIIQVVQNKSHNYQAIQFLHSLNQFDKFAEEILKRFALDEEIKGFQNVFKALNPNQKLEQVQIVKVGGKIRVLRRIKRQVIE